MKLQGTGQKQGFTLIEIIIVVVILGILAAIALPRLTGNIDYARAAEAFNIASAVGQAFDRCVTASAGGVTPVAAEITACSTLDLIGVTAPVSSNFNYSIPSFGGTSLTFLAVGTGGTLAATDVITFTFNGATGTTAKLCGGKLKPMCKS